MRTIEEIKKELKELEKEMSDKAKTYFSKETNDDKLMWHKEYSPLIRKKDELERELYEAKLFNINIGDGVTLWCWTDRYAYTVTKRTPKTIVVQRDNAIRTDKNGMSECQDYRYECNLNGSTESFRWSDKKRRWVNRSYNLTLGRHEYYDYSF